MRKSLSSLAKNCTAAVFGVAALVGSASAVVTNQNINVQGFTPATALELNPDGLGHILVVPYFTVNGGNDTYLSIGNTDVRHGKAVKVRFRGAGNSDDIFDFTVFLSPGDVWTAAVTKDASGAAKLITTDKSCTLPSTVGKGSGSAFVTARVPGNAVAATTEGYVEIFNMADVPPTLYSAGGATATANPLYTATKHVSGVAPCTASAFTPLNPTTNAGYTFFQSADSTLAAYTATEALGFTNPSTGLKANWTIINVPKSAAWTGAAVAVEARNAGGSPAVGNIVFSPQTADNVTLANARTLTADPLLRGGATTMATTGTSTLSATAPIQAAMYDLPDLSTPYTYTDLVAAANGVGTRAQAFKLTNALAASSVANEFVVDPAILGQTDWVFSLPTRRYNVARDYAGSATYYTNYGFDDAAGAIAGQWNFFSTANITTNTAYPNILCVGGISGAAGGNGTPTVRLTSGQTGDREETFLSSSAEFVVSPGVPGAAFAICGETSVFSFAANGQTSALGASLTRFDIGAPYTNGWARVATPGLSTGAATGLNSVATNAPVVGGNHGLPVIGFAVMQIKNNNAQPGLVGNYGLTFPHSRTAYTAQ